MLWVLLGCGGLFVVLSCVGGGAAAFFMVRKQRDERALASVEAEQRMEEEAAARERAAAEEERRAAEQAQAGVLGASPLQVTVTVTSSDLRRVPVGTTCAFGVDLHQLDQGPMCQAHVTCNGVALYGDQENNGYFPCTLTATSVTGADTGTTAEDTDPAISIDTTSGTISVTDDARGHLGAFHVTGSAHAGGGLGLVGPAAGS